MKFFGGELFALFTPMFSYILQKDDPESKIILQNRGTKHGLSRQDQGHSEMPLHERKEKYQLMTLSDFHTIHIDMIIISVQLERIISY